MPHFNDPTGPILDLVNLTLDGFVTTGPGGTGAQVPFYHGLPSEEGARGSEVAVEPPYANVGVTITGQGLLESTVEVQVDAFLPGPDPTKADPVRSSIFSLLTGLEGSLAGEFEITAVRVLPSPTLTEQGRAGNVAFHVVARVQFSVYAP